MYSNSAVCIYAARAMRIWGGPYLSEGNHICRTKMVRGTEFGVTHLHNYDEKLSLVTSVVHVCLCNYFSNLYEHNL